MTSVAGSVRAPRVHLVSYIDATESTVEPFATHDIRQFADAVSLCPGQVAVDAMIDRKPVSATVKAISAIGTLAAPIVAGASVGLLAGAPPALVGLACGLVAVEWTALATVSGALKRNLAKLDSAVHAACFHDGSWEGRRTYTIGTDSRQEVHEVQSSDKNAVVDFLSEQLKATPSSLNIVHMFGHGLAYRYAGGKNFADFKTTVDRVAQQSGHPIDLLLLESCQEGNFEGLASIAPSVRYAVVSEDSVYESVYGEMLKSALQEKGSTGDALQVGEAMLAHADGIHHVPNLLTRLYDLAGRRFLNSTEQAPTLALVDLSKMPALVGAVDKLGGVLSEESEGGGQPTLRKLLSEVPETSDWLKTGDLAILCQCLDEHYRTSSSPRAKAIRDASQAVQAALEKVVVGNHRSKHAGPGGGLSIQLPSARVAEMDEYERRFARFSDCAAPSGWKRFVAVMSNRV